MLFEPTLLLVMNWRSRGLLSWLVGKCILKIPKHNERALENGIEAHHHLILSEQH